MHGRPTQSAALALFLFMELNVKRQLISFCLFAALQSTAGAADKLKIDYLAGKCCGEVLNYTFAPAQLVITSSKHNDITFRNTLYIHIDYANDRGCLTH